MFNNNLNEIDVNEGKRENSVINENNLHKAKI